MVGGIKMQIMKRLLAATFVAMTVLSCSTSALAADSVAPQRCIAYSADSNSAPAAYTEGYVTKEEAILIALRSAKLKKKQVKNIKVKKKGSCYEVEFIKKSNKVRYEYDIYIHSGGVREEELEYPHARNTSKSKISKAAAYKIVAKKSGFSLAKVKNGSMEYKEDDGEWTYVIKFNVSHCKYEYTLLAPSGKLIEVSRTFEF